MTSMCKNLNGKSTPGPWKVSGRFDIYEDTQEPGVGGTYIGTTRGNGPLPESINVQCEANARLMADAPRLLEVLRELHDFAEPMRHYEHRARKAFRDAASLLDDHGG